MGKKQCLCLCGQGHFSHLYHNVCIDLNIIKKFYSYRNEGERAWIKTDE